MYDEIEVLKNSCDVISGSSPLLRHQTDGKRFFILGPFQSKFLATPCSVSVRVGNIDF